MNKIKKREAMKLYASDPEVYMALCAQGCEGDGVINDQVHRKRGLHICNPGFSAAPNKFSDYVTQ